MIIIARQIPTKQTRKHSSRMRTDCTITRPSSEPVAMRPIVVKTPVKTLPSLAVSNRSNGRVQAQHATRIYESYDAHCEDHIGELHIPQMITTKPPMRHSNLTLFPTAAICNVMSECGWVSLGLQIPSPGLYNFVCMCTGSK